MPEFSRASMKRLIKKAGSDRVSKDAALELSTILEEKGENIAKEAKRKARQDGVKTIKKKHIREAFRNFEK